MPQIHFLNKGAVDLFFSMHGYGSKTLKQHVTSKFGRKFIHIFLNLVLNKTLFVHQICTIILLSASLYKVNKKHGILMNYMSLNGRASFIDKLFKLSIFFQWRSSLKLKLTQDIYLQYKKHLKVMHSGFSIFFLQIKYLWNFFAFK